ERSAVRMHDRRKCRFCRFPLIGGLRKAGTKRARRGTARRATVVGSCRPTGNSLNVFAREASMSGREHCSYFPSGRGLAWAGLLLTMAGSAFLGRPVEAAVIVSNLNNSSNAADINNGTPGDPNQNWDASSFHVDSNNYTLSDIVVQISLDPNSTSTNFE